MSKTSRKVTLHEPVDADKIFIKRDHYFSDAYIIDFPLSATPDHVWQDLFEREWKSSRHLWDRKIFVISDKLRLVTHASDIEDKIDWIKQMIERANQAVDVYEQEEKTRALQEKEPKKRTPEEEKAGIETMKEILRRRLGGI